MNYSEFYEIVEPAFNELRLVRLIYTKRTGETNSYIVEPYKIDYPYFWGRRVDIIPPLGIRKFVISEIEDVQVLDDTFEPIWEVEK